MTNSSSSPETPDFQRIFESLPDAYMVLAPDLRILAASDAYLAATMRDRSGMIGRHVFDVFPDNPNDPSAKGSDTVRASFDRVRRTLKPDVMDPLKYDIRAPGSNEDRFEVRYWAVNNSPVLGAQGQLLYILNMPEDVTERVRSQERESQLEKQKAELRRRTANISHELRTPLNAIIGFAELMIDDNLRNYTPQQRHLYLQKIHAAGKELLALVDNIMELSTVEESEMAQGAGELAPANR